MSKVKREVGEHVSLNASLEPTKTKDLGEGIIEAVITTGGLDHHNENIVVEGVDTSLYHGPVLYGHDYEGLPIGKTISLTKMKSKIKARFQLAVKEYPFAGLVYDMIKGGYLTDVSIGGLVKKWSDDFQTIEEMTMKEFSVVPIGANPEAMITAIKQFDKTPDDLRKDYQQFVRQVTLDKLKHIDDDELNQSIANTEKLLAILKEAAQAQSSEGKVEPEVVRRIKKVRLHESAKAVIKESERTIRLIKLKS